jgi:ketosteroid isomerase-like protein
MDQPGTVTLARRLLAGIGEGQPADLVAALFSDDVQFEIPGDDGVLPWIGHRTGRQAVINFISTTRALLEPLSFDVEDIAASATRAVIVGELASRVKATDKVVETAFAIILTIAGERIARFQMLENSFAVSLAARA